jgi:hypothetical protein
MLLCSEHASKLDKPLIVNVVADSCGSGGLYYRLQKVLNQGILKVHPNLKYVRISASCKANHWSFAGEMGGEYSYFKYFTQQLEGTDNTEIFRAYAGP